MSKKQWNLATLESISRACNYMQSNQFTYNFLKNQQLSIIVDETQSCGKTPDKTLSRVLQVLRDLGIIKFVDNKGLYELIPSKETQVENLLKSKKSSGERALCNLLKGMGVKYISEKKFPWLKMKSFLRIDAYIEFKNAKIAIEVDGPQHFHPVPFFGGDSTYLHTVLRDEHKNRTLLNHNVNVIRISDKKIKTEEGKQAIVKVLTDIKEREEKAVIHKML